MQIRKNLTILLSAVLLSICTSASADESDNFPNKTITVLCTHSPGGDTDYNAQLLAFYLSDKLKVAVEVQNVPGNNGTTALNRFKNVEHDGYTLLATNSSALCSSEATGISSYSYQDFEPVAIYGRQCGENILVQGDSPYETLEDLLDFATKRPNKLKIGVSMGASSFIASVILDKVKHARFKMVDVGGDADGRVGALRNRYTDVTIAPYALVKNELSDGSLRSLATLMSTRLAAAPDIPTVKECGLPDLTIDTFYVVLAPKGTPAAIVEKLNQNIQELVLKNEDYKAMVQDYNQQEPFVLSVKDTVEALKQQRDHIMSYSKYLN